MRANLLALVSAAVVSSCDGGEPGATCGGFRGDPSVTPGLGLADFAELVEGAVATPIVGSQGGSHVFVGARLRGFASPVEVSVEARDAFSHARLGVGRSGAVSTSTRTDAPADSCDVRGVQVFLQGVFPNGAGLAEVTVAARDGAGTTRSASRRAWIGPPLPACLPGGEARLVPLTLASTAQRRDEAQAITAGATLRAGASGDVLLGAGVLGLAASAVSLAARVYDDAGGARAVLREVRAGMPDGDVTQVPSMRRAAPECVAPVTLRLPVDAAMAGRPLRLALTADDGLGHARTEERTVRFLAATPFDAGTAPDADAAVIDAGTAPDAPPPDVAPPADAPADLPADVPADLPADVPAADASAPPRAGLVLRSAQDFGVGAHARELVVDGDTVYLADSNGLPVVDTAAGATRLVHAIVPSREQHCSTAALHARSRTLVCAAGDSGFLDLIDVRDPAAPRSRPWDLNAHDPAGGRPISAVADVEVVGDTAWMAAQSTGLLRVTLGADGTASALTRTGLGVDLVGVVSDGARLALVDRVEGLSVRELPGLELTAAAALDGPPLDVAIDGDRVAVALGAEGARVFRLAGGALSPPVVVQPRCVATAVALSGDRLAVACLTGVTLYDLRAPSPRVAGFYPARHGMLDAAFSTRGLLVSDWYGLDLFDADPSGEARVPDVPLGLRVRPGDTARIGLRNPGAATLELAWRASPSSGPPVAGAITLPPAGEAVLTLPFARTGLVAGAGGGVDVEFAADGRAAEARTRVVWRASTDDPARGIVAIGDRFPTLRRTVDSPFPATLPPVGAETLVMFLTVDCFLQWPQLEDMAWSRARGAALPAPTVLYLTTDDESPFDPSDFMRSHAAAALPTFEWADYSRSVPGQEAQTSFVRAFETTFFMRLPGSDFPHDYLVAADGTTLATLREYRGRWPLPR